MSTKKKTNPIIYLSAAGLALAAFVAYKQGLFSTRSQQPQNAPQPQQIGQEWQSSDGVVYRAESDGAGGVQWTPILLGVIDALTNIFGGNNSTGSGSSANSNLWMQNTGAFGGNMGGNPYTGYFQ